LAEYVRRHKQQAVIRQFGTFDFDRNYEYKSARRLKRQ
jgi:hypothetical protein